MKIYFFVISFFILSYSYSEELATNFNVLPKALSPSDQFNGYNDIGLSYNSQNDQVVFSWKNYGTPYSAYAIYDFSSKKFKIKPTLIGGSTPINNVFSAYNSSDNVVVFHWVERDTNIPKMRTYDFNTEELGPISIIGKSSNRGKNNVHSCYNSKDNQIIFAWVNPSTHYPIFAIYDFTTKTFPVTGDIVGESLALDEAHTNVHLVYSSYDNQVFFGWGRKGNLEFSYNDLENKVVFTWADDGNNHPHYSVYDCDNDSFVTRDKVPGVVKASAKKYAYYTIYDPTTQTFAHPPQKISTTKGIRDLVNACFNSQTNQTIFSWSTSDAEGGLPTYAVYDHSTQTFPIGATLISPVLRSVDNVSIVYNSKNSLIVYAWSHQKEKGKQPSPPYFAIEGIYYPSSVLIQQSNNSTVKTNTF